MNETDMPIENLLEQVEEYRLRREVRDGRPDRITDFITEIAEIFEPLHGVGRVGFDCQAAYGGWNISMYLGATEVVGGRDDGLHNHAPFHFDIDAAIAVFENVESVQFSSEHANRTADSGITISGHVDDLPVCLAIHASPPATVGAGLQRMPDRSLRLT